MIELRTSLCNILKYLTDWGIQPLLAFDPRVNEFIGYMLIFLLSLPDIWNGIGNTNDSLLISCDKIHFSILIPLQQIQWWLKLQSSLLNTTYSLPNEHFYFSTRTFKTQDVCFGVSTNSDDKLVFDRWMQFKIFDFISVGVLALSWIEY